MISPSTRFRFAMILLVLSLIGWPVTALTVFRGEPQGILGLSWFALILTAIDIACTTDVRRQKENTE